MARAQIPVPSLSDWVDLLGRLRADTGVPATELRQRDRAIGAGLGHLDGKPAAKLAAWVRGTRAPDAAEKGSGRTPGQRTGEAVRLVGIALTSISLLFGAGAAVAAFSFQPLGRINVVAVLGVLVVLPNAFLLFAILGGLPDRVRQRLPWSGRDEEAGALQPARWALRALPQETRETLDGALGTAGAMAKLTGPLRRWLLLRTSQAAALAFQTGALAAAGAQVVFTDLSFGWSTTLDVDVESIHRLSTFVAAPWAWLWPDAEPSLAMLERTRFFRIAPQADSAVAVYGRWWPFVVAAVFFYGWLPRAAFLAISSQRLRATLRRAMVIAPGSQQVLARLESPLVESGATDGGDSDCRAEAQATSSTGGRDLPEAPLPDRAVAVSWSDALSLCGDGFSDTWAVTCLEAGGSRAPHEDEQTIVDAAALATRQDVPIVLAVRGYEPPLAEQIDFIAALRRALGDARPIVVAGIGNDDARLDAWRRRLATLGDPWLAVAPVPEVPA